eukprot:4747458-Ditylum_brightwellii.AAC.1
MSNNDENMPLTYNPVDQDDLETTNIYRSNRKYTLPVYDGKSKEQYLNVAREFDNTIMKAGI